MAFLDLTYTLLFDIFFVLFSFGFVLQFREFAEFGLSPEALLQDKFIKYSEQVQFIEFHLRKTVGTLVIHSVLPLVYVLGRTYFLIFVDEEYDHFGELLADNALFQHFVTLSIVIPISVLCLAYHWSLDNWSKHPFVSKIMPYARNGQWRLVIGDINTEFRRIDKFTIMPSPISKAVVTDNWIVYLGQWPWSLRLAHQSDVSIALIKSSQHLMSTDGQVGGSQYLTIEIRSSRPGIQSFRFRLNSLEYQNLTDKLQGPVENIENIRIFKSTAERFLEVFREEIQRNPSVEVTEELEKCIGCMVNTANVKLIRRCLEGEPRQNADACVNCYCRPMWCIDCLGKWFASRQNQQDTETWLSSKCPCPTCRSKFCILDVAVIQNADNND